MTNSKAVNDAGYIHVQKFNMEALESFYQSFCKLESDPAVSIIPILITSYGGDAYAALAMRDIIKSSSKPVSTIALGAAMSAGALLLAAGTKGYRFGSMNSTIMVHEVSTQQWGKASDIELSTQHLSRLNDSLLSALAEDSGRPKDFYRRKLGKLKNSDWFLTPAEAVEIGLIDSVGVPRTIETRPMVGLRVPRPRKSGRK